MATVLQKDLVRGALKCHFWVKAYWKKIWQSVGRVLNKCEDRAENRDEYRAVNRDEYKKELILEEDRAECR